MKLTFGEFIEKLQDEVERTPWIEDMYVTKIECISYSGIFNYKKPEEQLIGIRITTTSKDGNLQHYIRWLPETRNNDDLPPGVTNIKLVE